MTPYIYVERKRAEKRKMCVGVIANKQKKSERVREREREPECGNVLFYNIHKPVFFEILFKCI